MVAIATQESLLEKTVSNVKEVKARGAKVLAIAAEDCTAIEDVADEVVYLPKVNHLFTASYDVLPMQLFAYYIAVERAVMWINPEIWQNPLQLNKKQKLQGLGISKSFFLYICK